MSGISLSAGVRQNLLSLQNTATELATTQNRLATGKKVNSALDNPNSYFTAQALTNRANSPTKGWAHFRVGCRFNLFNGRGGALLRPYEMTYAPP